MKLTNRNIFLIDSAGAFINAATLGLILAPLDRIFGMPPQILYMLATIAIGYGMFSLLCHFFIKSNWRTYLKGITVLNMLYGMLTVYLVIQLRDALSIWGFLYFSAELVVLISLIVIENRVLQSK